MIEFKRMSNVNGLERFNGQFENVTVDLIGPADNLKQAVMVVLFTPDRAVQSGQRLQYFVEVVNPDVVEWLVEHVTGGQTTINGQEVTLISFPMENGAEALSIVFTAI